MRTLTKEQREHKRFVDRERKRRRRKEFFEDKKCESCGSVENLELHHRNQNEKEHHNIWSWSKERRLSETNKCDVLCHDCHVEYHRKTGSFGTSKRLTKDEVLEIREKIKLGKTQKEVAKEYGVGILSINRIVNRVTWKNI